jgi:hypothetical protein
MRPEDVRTPEDFQEWLTEHRAQLAEEYRTPRWERVLLAVVLAALLLVIVSGVTSVVLR